MCRTAATKSFNSQCFKSFRLWDDELWQMKVKEEKGRFRWIYVYYSGSGSYRTADRALKAASSMGRSIVQLDTRRCQISHAFIGPSGKSMNQASGAYPRQKAK